MPLTRTAGRVARAALSTMRFIGRRIRGLVRFVGWSIATVVTAALLLAVGNLFIQSPRDVPARALDPSSGVCMTTAAEWGILARPAPDGGKPGPANDELWAIDHGGPEWRQRFACSIQHHTIPGYRAPDGAERTIGYDLAFIEFHEDGKPYALRRFCDAPSPTCVDEGYGLVEREPGRGQIEAVLEHLKNRFAPSRPQYVLVWVHGWRHDARPGDANVTEFRSYAAQVARFLEDRAAADPSAPHPGVTAIYLGWRGDRTDESWLRHHWGTPGKWIGNALAWPTLFDRKPVSEAIGPTAVASLRAIERMLNLERPLDGRSGLPPPQANHMIVFAHSLGANMLATALEPDLVKKVERHAPGSYMLPVLGDLVVLINPAAEATKWTAIQRAVWTRMAMLESERAAVGDYMASHAFFAAKQRPILISVTAALDWPPGGNREVDCTAGRDPDALVGNPDYDGATHDLFPAFKGDFRPLADYLERVGTGSDPHDACRVVDLPWWRRPAASLLVGLSNLLRTVPFMQTDPEQTQTIGQLDPPRSLQRFDRMSGRPVGTTHVLFGLDPNSNVERAHPRPEAGGDLTREVTLDYGAITGPFATCPVASGWLDKARTVRLDKGARSSINWSSSEAQIAPGAPALRFDHGFRSWMPAITRANDPFWNMRAYDTALARHDGYMLTSFICAMNQLVLDRPTEFDVPPATPPAQAAVVEGTATP